MLAPMTEIDLPPCIGLFFSSFSHLHFGSDFAFHTLSVVMNTNKNLGACRAEGYEAEMFVEFFPDKSDYFSHGKCGQNGANSKSFDASETNAGDQCGGCQTDDIKGYFYF